MKYTFAVAVLLAGHIITNIAGDSDDKEDDCENGSYLSLNTILDKEWSVKDISPEDCERVKDSTYQPEKISKEIQKSWENASKCLKKKTDSRTKISVQEILKTFEKNEKTIKDLLKISHNEYNRLVEKSLYAQNTTIEFSTRHSEFVNVTINMLGASILSAINIPVEVFINKIKEFSQKCHTEIYCLAASGEVEAAKLKSKVSVSEILSLSGFIDNWLMNAYRLQSKSATDIASKAGEIILKGAKKYINKIKSTQATEKRLLSYINTVVKDIQLLALHTKDAFNIFSATHLDTIEVQIKRNIESIKRIATVETELNKAIANSRTAEIDELENEIRSIYETFKQINNETKKNVLQSLNVIKANVIADIKKQRQYFTSIRNRPFAGKHIVLMDPWQTLKVNPTKGVRL